MGRPVRGKKAIRRADIVWVAVDRDKAPMGLERHVGRTTKKEAVLGASFLPSWIMVAVFVSLACFNKTGGLD